MIQTVMHSALSFDLVVAEWQWARKLCRDLLVSLDDTVLNQSPLPGCGSWAKQFRHLGRVEENYITALETGMTNFTTEGCTFNGPMNVEALVRYLDHMDQKLLQTLSKPCGPINWFGEEWSVARHIRALSSHEILHHGQFILYARVGGVRLPESWKDWGE